MRNSSRLILGLGAIGLPIALLLAAACYCNGNAHLAAQLSGNPHRVVAAYTFSNRFHINDIFISDQADTEYLSECFRMARHFDMRGDFGLNFDCCVAFVPCGRAWCRVSPGMNRDALWVRAFMPTLAGDEDHFIVELKEPIPEGVKDLLRTLRNASRARAETQPK